MIKSTVMLSRIMKFTVVFSAFIILVSLALTACFAEEALVTRVIDGDTVVLENGEHVRYIGIDTPERGRPYYAEAKRENERSC